MNILCKMCDDVTTKLNEIEASLQSIAQHKGAGWTDVIIALIVCLALVILARIVFKSITQWKKDIIEAEKNKLEQDRIDELEDRKLKLKADYQSLIINYMKEKWDSYIKIPSDGETNTDQKSFDNDPYIIKIQGYLNELNKPTNNG